jgi:hypothetical protein
MFLASGWINIATGGELMILWLAPVPTQKENREHLLQKSRREKLNNQLILFYRVREKAEL